MEERRRTTYSPATKRILNRLNKGKYEKSGKRPTRHAIKLSTECYRRWCELRDTWSNEEFMTVLLAQYEGEVSTSYSETASVASVSEDRTQVAEESSASAPESVSAHEPSTPVSFQFQQERMLEEGLFALTSTPGKDDFPDDIHVDNVPDEGTSPSPVHSRQQETATDHLAPCQQRHPAASEWDLAHSELHDISVNVVEDEDFIYPQEEVGDGSDASDFSGEVILQRGGVASSLEKVGEEEDVLGVMVEVEPPAETTRSGLHVKVSADASTDLEFFLISKTRLQDLSQKAYGQCDACGGAVTTSVSSGSGTAAHISWTCTRDPKHGKCYCTQEVVDRSHAGDIRLASALLLSGNNFDKIALMAKFSKLNFFSGTTFYKLQENYILPAIEKHWEDLQQEAVSRHSGSPVIVCGDARNDSPGHNAQYATYTLMESATNDVLHVGFVDKRETDNRSPNMEIKAFKDGLAALEEKGLTVGEVVTDAHPSIAKYMRESKPQIKHSWDVWHGTKNLAKKITRVASRAATRALLFWVKHIVRHFWYCAETCNGNVTNLKAKWHGMTHHVTNRHTWTAGLDGPTECAHGELVELEERQEWLKQGGEAHKALVQVCYDKRFISNMNYYVNYRHTSMLESLHNHILMYASKRFAFRYPAYRARNLLAVIDFMEHKDRPDQLNADGTPKQYAVWSKHQNDYVARRTKVPKTYPYIEPLMKDIFHRKAADQAPMFRRSSLMPGDPRLIRPRLAPFPAPHISEVLARRGGQHNVVESEVD